MYTIQYWHETQAQWRGCGERPCPDRTVTLDRMRALREQCNGCVRFRAVLLT